MKNYKVQISPFFIRRGRPPPNFVSSYGKLLELIRFKIHAQKCKPFKSYNGVSHSPPKNVRLPRIKNGHVHQLRGRGVVSNWNLQVLLQAPKYVSTASFNSNQWERAKLWLLNQNFNRDWLEKKKYKKSFKKRIWLWFYMGLKRLLTKFGPPNSSTLDFLVKP